MEQRGAIEHPSAVHSDRVARQPIRLPLFPEIGVSKCGAELRAIIAQVGVQKVGLGPRNQHLETAQMPRVAVEKSQRLERRIYNIARRLEDRETSSVREHLARAAGGE